MTIFIPLRHGLSDGVHIMAHHGDGVLPGIGIHGMIHIGAGAGIGGRHGPGVRHGAGDPVGVRRGVQVGDPDIPDPYQTTGIHVIPVK